MARVKLTEYSATASSNTELNGISLAENAMTPASVNDAFRENMKQLKDFVAGTTGLDVLHFQDDDASHFLKFQAPSSVTTSTTFTLPDGDGSVGQALKTDGSGALSFGTFLTSIASDSIGATEINVSGNGTSGQALLSDGDGSFSFGNVETNQAFQSTTGTDSNNGSTVILTRTITPTSTSSKILLLGCMTQSVNDSNISIEFKRDSTLLVGSMQRGDGNETIGSGATNAANLNLASFFIDEPNTTSQVSYTMVSDRSIDTSHNATLIAIEISS